MLTVKQIMLLNTDQVIDKDRLFQPSDLLLDEIWKHTIATTKDKGMLMSDVVNGDTALDRHLVEFAMYGGLLVALKLRERALELFRHHAYTLAEEHEIDVMEAINAPPEPEYG